MNTVLRPEHQLSKPGSCGRPAPGVDIALFDDAGNVVTAPNTEGELFVKSANMFSTYHKAHDKFEADRRDGWQTVGDIAMFDEEGFYYICDRKKDMIISGGVNIYPAEIEAALEAAPRHQRRRRLRHPRRRMGRSRPRHRGRHARRARSTKDQIIAFAQTNTLPATKCRARSPT